MNKAEETGKFIKDTTQKTKEYLTEQTGQFFNRYKKGTYAKVPQSDDISFDETLKKQNNHQ